MLHRRFASLLNPGVLGRPPLTSLTFRASSTSSTGSITWPTGTVEGDFVIFTELANDASVPAESSPSGWTTAPSDMLGDTSGSGTPYRVKTWLKIMTAADITAGSVTGMDGTYDRKICLCFYPNAGAVIASFSISLEAKSSSTGGNPTSISVNATGAATPNILFGQAACSSADATFSTASPAFDAQVDNNRVRVGYKVNASASHTFDVNNMGNRSHVAAALLTFF